MVCPVLLHRRGVSRSSRTLAAGCDGRFGFTAPTARTNGAEAYGQGAWSRPPDAGVKSDGDHPAGDGGYQARYSGESALYAVNTIAQGRPDCFGDLWRRLVCFLPLHTRLRVRKTPGFPCALCSSRGMQDG